MNILVPFNDSESLNDFIKAGASEFYLGFYDPAWEETFGKYSDINRMTGFGKEANKYNFSEAADVVGQIRGENQSAFVTMNANTYSKDQIDFITENYLPVLKDADITGIIVSDLFLARRIVEFGLNPVASTMCGIYNSDIAKAYKRAGLKRIIVPRDLSLEEIEEIKSAVPDVEFEVFFMRNGCVFSDCYCLGMHRSECGATCAFIRNHYKRFMTKNPSFEERQKNDFNNLFYNEYFHRETCGMCALYRLKEIGVGSLKIVGRSDYPEDICRDIEWISENIKIAEKSKNESQFLDEMIFPGNASRKCLGGLSCYYPEVRFRIL